MKPKFKLSEEVSSPQDLKTLILEIHDYARWYSHNAIKKRLRVQARRKDSLEPTLSSAASAVIYQWAQQHPLSPKSFDELLATLDTYARTAPEFTVTLAAAPTNGLKRILVGWCRDNIAPNVLVNFQFNAGLLGGMVVRSGSHVYDWSFRRQILNNLDKFPEVLRRV
jgi:hypothetical protein